MALALKDFTALKEIQSLDNFIKKHLDAIASEESRKESIHKMRAKRESEKVGLLEKQKENTALISGLEKDLFDWEKKKEHANESLQRATDAKQLDALEKEISQAVPKCEELEETILNLLEENEDLDQSISEADTFLSGSLETLKNIDLEIQEETKEERRQILNYEERISYLLEELPSELLEVFNRARKKHRFNSSLARIINRACEKCRYEVDSQTLSQVDQAKVVIQCNQCERLLIPYDA